MPEQNKNSTIQYSNGRNQGAHDPRHKAARYLQLLDDGRTFARYAERAFSEAAQLSPDGEAFSESVALRSSAGQLRRRAQEFKQKGLARFNPRRGTRRVVIDDSPG